MRVSDWIRLGQERAPPAPVPLGLAATMEARLVVLLLCCAAPGARAGLPVVDSAAPPEARSAAALLTPFMASQKATLIVLGSSRWTEAFLRELSADIPRVLAPRPSRDSTALKHDNYSNTQQLDRLRHGLMATRLAHFVPTDDVDELFYILKTYPLSRRDTDVRVLFWTTVSASAPQGEVEQRVSRLDAWLGGLQRALALTYPNGSTTLYNLTRTSYDASWGTKTSVIEMDNWSLLEERWRLGVTVFHEYCRGYRQSGKRQDLTVYLRLANGLTKPSSLMELTKSALNLVSRGHQRRMGLQTRVKYQLTWGYETVTLALKECICAAYLAEELFFSRYELAEISLMPDMELAEFAVFVPAGYGANVGVLDAVTVEFSPALWLATALATLSTVVVFACARRQDVGGAVLQALAPMLGQAPPPAPPRPMLAAWLLACVVLTAAYQGLLLGKLSSAVPRRELESLQDLEDSGLPLKARGNLAYGNVLTDNLNARIETVEDSEIKTIIDTIATARNCALVTFYTRRTYSYVRPHILPYKKLHVIRLSYSHLNIIAVTTKGSPLERPLATAQARVEAAGLLSRWRRAEYERGYQDDAKGLAALPGPRCMTLWHLQPAFVVLGVGHVASVIAFAFEALWAWRRGGRGRRDAGISP